ncbi:epoxyqueuosine reductase QueH [Lactimicrobium massiliense]|uniref:epoxyqueuosine reductase QueH n=1 Tax=Lactimicrobium massiliense TaxID=2161814 RepID=UPI000D5531AE|nr:epoxyqueuosine reductase QueH [Lactimicrobium massiliense]
MNESEKEEYRTYLASRKSSQRTNWYLKSLDELKQVKASGTKPKLLMHACCGPCAGWPLEFLHDYFDITILYNNSNIYPASEYQRREQELERLLPLLGMDDVKVVVPPYDNAAYTREVLSARADDPEGWKRCFGCYRARMKEGFAYAHAHGFGWFTTVMTISRQKDSQVLNQIGLELAKDYPDIHYFVSDFKKKGGQVRRDEIVSEFNLYHQDYCGCIYSYHERHQHDE